jgi:hypothetical protein
VLFLLAADTCARAPGAEFSSVTGDVEVVVVGGVAWGADGSSEGPPLPGNNGCLLVLAGIELGPLIGCTCRDARLHENDLKQSLDRLGRGATRFLVDDVGFASLQLGNNEVFGILGTVYSGDSMSQNLGMNWRAEAEGSPHSHHPAYGTTKPPPQYIATAISRNR